MYKEVRERLTISRSLSHIPASIRVAIPFSPRHFKYTDTTIEEHQSTYTIYNYINQCFPTG